MIPGPGGPSTPELASPCGEGPEGPPICRTRRTGTIFFRTYLALPACYRFMFYYRSRSILQPGYFPLPQARDQCDPPKPGRHCDKVLSDPRFVGLGPGALCFQTIPSTALVNNQPQDLLMVILDNLRPHSSASWKPSCDLHDKVAKDPHESLSAHHDVFLFSAVFQLFPLPLRHSSCPLLPSSSCPSSAQTGSWSDR